MKIHICKASQTIYTEPVPSIEIRIGDGEFPEFKTLPDLARFAGIEAERLEASLYRSLPGATYDRLLGRMLQRKSTHFRVAHYEPKTEPVNETLLEASKRALSSISRAKYPTTYAILESAVAHAIIAQGKGKRE